MHQENDDQGHGDVETDATKAKDASRDSHDQTMNEGMISKNKSIFLAYATKIKDYRLTTPKGRSAYIEENFDMEQVAVVKSRNSMILVDEYVSIHDSLSLIETIRLSLRLSVFMKFKLYQMDVNNALSQWVLK